MIKGHEHLNSKHYWALLLLGPPLKVVFAFALFAGLHLGLGLPWPTLEDAGFVASILELIGFGAFLIVVDLLILGRIYRMNFFTLGLPKRDFEKELIGLVAGIFGIGLGFAIVLATAMALSLTAIVDFEHGGFFLFLVSMTSSIGFTGAVAEGERKLRDRANGARA